MNRAVWGTLAVLAVVAAAAGGFWMGRHQPSDPAAGVAVSPAKGGAPVGAGQAVAVTAVRATSIELPTTITAVGSLRSDESVTVRPEVAGRISAILFKEGERVSKGAPLVKLDPSINEADVQQARANLKLAKSKYERAVDLAKSNFISSQARDEAENNLRVAEAALALSEAKLAKTQIVAPFSGTIGLRSVSLGDYVKEGQDIVNLEAIDPLKVDFRVPEIYLREVRVGQTLQVALDAMPGTAFDGKVYAINPLIDAAGRSVVIRAQVKNQNATLRPGMFARVRLITSERQNAVMVPEQSIVPQGEEQFVFRVVDGRAVRSKVAVGQRRESMVEIVSGVAAGDLVVTAGQLKLREGVPVKIVEAPAAQPPLNDARARDGVSEARAQETSVAVRPAEPTAPAREGQQAPPARAAKANAGSARPRS